MDPQQTKIPPQINIDTNVPMPSHNRGKGFWVSATVLLVIAVLAGVFWLKTQNKLWFFGYKKQPVVSNKLPQGYTYQAIDSNNYPEGFPKELVVSGGIWQRGESTKVATGETYKIVELLYNNSGVSVSEQFKNNFLQAGWIIGSLNSNSGSDTYIFKKDSQEMSATFTSTAKTTLVNLTYKLK
jgi:hypothetical protein